MLGLHLRPVFEASKRRARPRFNETPGPLASICCLLSGWRPMSPCCHPRCQHQACQGHTQRAVRSVRPAANGLWHSFSASRCAHAVGSSFQASTRAEARHACGLAHALAGALNVNQLTEMPQEALTLQQMANFQAAPRQQSFHQSVRACNEGVPVWRGLGATRFHCLC